MPGIDVKIVVDNRERSVFEGLGINDFTKVVPEDIILASMTTADYALVADDAILEIFERKTYEDYAESLKDGRHKNKDKMKTLRNMTGCRVYYIIEGIPPEDESISIRGIPYGSIWSSIMNLMSNHGIFVLYSKDQHDTARLLRKKKKTLENTISRGDFAYDRIEGNPVDLLTKPVPVSISDIIANMYAMLPGISEVTSKVLAKEIKLSDYLFDRDSLNGVLDNMTVNGRKIPKNRVKSLMEANHLEVAEMFMAIPGLTNTICISDALKECQGSGQFKERVLRDYPANIARKIHAILNY